MTSPKLAGGILVLVLANALLSSAGAQQSATDVTAFIHVTVVPMDRERLLQDQTVLVQHGRITALGPSSKVRIPAKAVRIEARGKVLIPGLADMHAHTTGGADPMGFNWARDSDRLLLKKQQLFLWLAHGLTTVRNMDHTKLAVPDTTGSNGSGLDWFSDADMLALRAQAAAGEILSPRIYTSGTLGGQLSRDRWGGLGLSEVAPAVQAYKAAGFDFIKIYTGTLADGVFDSLVTLARQAGLPLDGHVAVPFDRALATYRSIEHLTGYFYFTDKPLLDYREPDSVLAPCVRAIAAATRRAGVWNTPTLYNLSRNHLATYSDPREVALGRQIVKALQDAGAGLLAGSDRLQFPSRGDNDSLKNARWGTFTPAQQRLEIAYGDAGATHNEFQALVDAGLTPYQALATGTRNVAAFFGTLDSTGTITVGKRADLVLLDGNPLVDIRQTERIAGVMLGGRWLDRVELDRRTAEISAWLEQRCPATGHAVAPCPVGLKSKTDQP